MDEDTIVQFASITGSSPTLAAQYLRLADNNTEQAIELFYANEGADLEPSSQLPHSSHPQPISAASSRPTGHRQGYQDEEGVVHLDSDQEDPDYSEHDVEVVRQNQGEPSTAGRSTSMLQDSSSATPPVGQASMAVDDDEAMARRLQEELYGVTGRSGGDGAEMVDEHGYRAPIGRTTETLVGQGSFDPTDEDEMRAAVMEQMVARRQPPRQRGEQNPCVRIGAVINGHRSSWDI